MGAGLATRPVAAGAAHRERRVDGLGLAEHGVGEGELHHDFGVRAAGRAARAAAAPERVAAEERLEEVAEPERLAATGPRRAALTKEVVAAATFGVAQRLVRDADLLEPLLGVGVVGLRVGVVPAGEVAVRPLDVLVGGVASDAERLVVV